MTLFTKLGGYFFDFSNVRNLMDKLGIEYSESDVKEYLYERPINEWLASHKPKFLSSRIQWPLDPITPESTDGIIVCTQYWPVHHEDLPGPDREEREEDLEVKEWLCANGVERSGMQWVCFLDKYGIAGKSGKKDTAETRQMTEDELWASMKHMGALVKKEMAETRRRLEEEKKKKQQDEEKRKQKDAKV
ncbi:uncharacterized protein STEHIDRAFT_143003 [Stereum hirsutum FP-91666 SS1]|uniref:Uncharacterized protein n=1 Tax=Stereum hirsutum (strain FP-91666) TaxID=721885 RepID=R7RY28_STEHR|nr:uncharacterized protein STEHIDRAFT_143003 [Stereum hirsutum FP-91666 SS1]EIM80239.1 hypothetical protein STEHIDRAFT_143003 [Stereum hirsutum FP-91666 SS1]